MGFTLADLPAKLETLAVFVIVHERWYIDLFLRLA